VRDQLVSSWRDVAPERGQLCCPFARTRAHLETQAARRPNRGGSAPGGRTHHTSALPHPVRALGVAKRAYDAAGLPVILKGAQGAVWEIQ
jgi:hypothetical protein